MTDTEKAEYIRVLEELVAENDRLKAELECLKAGLGAREYLQSVWRNPTSPEGNRIKAAQAVLPHESAPLKPIEPPLDLVAQEYKPLSELVQERRKRCDELLALPLEERSRLITGVGNSGDDSSAD